MAQDCWSQRNLDIFLRQSRRSVSPPPPMTHRRRSKSTSTSAEEGGEEAVLRRWDLRRPSNNLENIVEPSSFCSFPSTINNNGSILDNVDSMRGISGSSGNLLAGGRELIIGERIRARTRTLSGNGNVISRLRSRKNSGDTRDGSGRSKVIEIFNVVVLTCVFVLGVLSAVFVIVCYKNGSLSMGPSLRRTEMFQPFPQAQELEIIDERYLDIGSFQEDLYLKAGVDGDDDECEGENKLALELEAISSVRSALEKKEQGKIAKAQKLFQHAMALCPRHPDVLTHYGEFHEETRQDYMMADHLYVQALTYSPRHTKALINRKRTLPVVEELDEKRLKRIDSKRQQLTHLSDSNRALRRIRKEAYFQHIYHSAGIEGNTMSLAQTRLIVETRMAVGGKSIIEHNEILGLDAALRFVNTTLVNRIGKVTLEDILAIHRHLMALVDPGEAGRLRRTQVFVGSHVPPPPEELLKQMEQLVEWLNSEEALSLHPIHYAAIAHYKFVYIHPFIDGNGRTSRLLMNWILMQADYPPVIIRKQDRMLYYEHLNTANRGDLRPFIRFIGDCTEKTMDVYLWATQERHILELEDDHHTSDKEIER